MSTRPYLPPCFLLSYQAKYLNRWEKGQQILMPTGYRQNSMHLRKEQEQNSPTFGGEAKKFWILNLTKVLLPLEERQETPAQDQPQI